MGTVIRHFVELAKAALFLAAVAGPASAAPPNILLILADDLGFGDLGCYGAPDIRTPVLDQLARDGCRFSQFYSNGPECSPTRTALMTGRYQHRVGGLECAIGVHNVGRYDDAIRLAGQHQLGLPVEEGSLPQYLKQAGYTCGLFGKWHLGYEPHFLPKQHGFDKTFGIMGGNADYFRHTEEDGWPVLIEDDQPTEREGYLTDLFTDAALAWYDTVKSGDRPFFLYLPYTCPHAPLQGPRDQEAGRAATDGADKAARRKVYIEMVEHMDQQIGRVLAALDADRLRGDTLVIFMSDNGGTGISHNSPLSGTKGTTHEGGIRIPCIARWPGHVPEGRVVHNIGITMDWTKSLVRVAGATGPQDRPFDGIDLLAEIEQDQPAHPRTLFWRGRRGENTWRGVRDGDLKAVWNDEGNEHQRWLFDLANDPSEMTDLLGRRSDDAARLTTLLREWEAEVRPRR
jgi:arylsulfatase A